MSKLVIKSDTEKNILNKQNHPHQAECFDRLMDLAEKHNISFNKVVNQCIEYALENLDE